MCQRWSSWLEWNCYPCVGSCARMMMHRDPIGCPQPSIHQLSSLLMCNFTSCLESVLVSSNGRTGTQLTTTYNRHQFTKSSHGHWGCVMQPRW
jgi:hypothetical protein